MNKDISISVVIPCYNAESTILKCLDSVINQTIFVNEIICIDDGSSDRTVEILNAYADNVPESVGFKVIEQKNSGPSAARNKGVAISLSDWVAFLDSDDFWLHDKIEHQISHISKHNISIIGCVKLRNNTKMDFRYVSLRQLLYKNYFITSSVLVKKCVIQKYPFDENQRYSEDYKAWLFILSEHVGGVITADYIYPIEKTVSYLGSGLSSNIEKMEREELRNYKSLFQKKLIGMTDLFCASIFSYLKFLRRKWMKNK